MISKALWAEFEEPHMQSYLFVVSLPQFAPGWGSVWGNVSVMVLCVAGVESQAQDSRYE
jgi:hypothetical protein